MHEEKTKVTYNHQAMSHFSNFIEECGMMDIPLSGDRFIWCSNILEATFCKLDRFLFSPSFMCVIPNKVQKVLHRLLSDHNAVVLAEDEVNWGPKSFKFFNHWMEVKGF